MNEVYLLLGSNQGNPVKNLHTAVKLIRQQCGTVVKSSMLYETEAWGIKEQNSFLNQAILITTLLTPPALLIVLKAIEQETGRVETFKWGPRIIDIDILFYGNQLIDMPDLKIPHPFIQNRRFTLVPMSEIAPGFVHPVLKKTMAQLLHICNDNSEVKVRK